MQEDVNVTVGVAQQVHDREERTVIDPKVGLATHASARDGRGQVAALAASTADGPPPPHTHLARR